MAVTDASDLQRRFLLALCLWREARGESQRGKELVAQVIVNRAIDGRWPKSIVGVILQPMQFSSFNKNDPNATLFPAEGDVAWDACVEAAESVLANPAPITTANHYCVVGLTPSWAQPEKVVAQEGRHVFYCL